MIAARSRLVSGDSGIVESPAATAGASRAYSAGSAGTELSPAPAAPAAPASVGASSADWKPVVSRSTVALSTVIQRFHASIRSSVFRARTPTRSFANTLLDTW